MTRANRLASLRRQIILEAAERVFARAGLENTTIRAIATEANCTTGAIYPWFNSKEAIYAALLEASLGRLHAHLATQLAQAPADRAARAVIDGFFDYYAYRPTEFSLGLYLFQGLAPRGLGPDWDTHLNGLLQQSIDLIGTGLAASKGWNAERVRLEQMHVFTYLMGLILLLHTRRLKSLAQPATTLLDQYCLTLEKS